jgi:hypothetical protein
MLPAKGIGSDTLKKVAQEKKEDWGKVVRNKEGLIQAESLTGYCIL